MLLNKLYTIRHMEVRQDGSGLVAEIEIDHRHPVFEGHFPGNPLLPGVCTVQIIKELLEKAVNRPLIMAKAKNIKYLGFVNPGSMPLLDFMLQMNNLEDGVIGCAATVSAKGMGVCSFKGEFMNFTH